MAGMQTLRVENPKPIKTKSTESLFSLYSEDDPFDISNELVDEVTHAASCVGIYLHEKSVKLNTPPENRTTFDAATEPIIGIIPYFQRICQYSKLTPESAICANILVQRLCANPENQLQLTNFNVHRLILAASMVFAKFYDDDIDLNGRWAKIAGVSLSELNLLEVDFLNACEFDLRVSLDSFQKSVDELLPFLNCEPTVYPQPSCSTTARASVRVHTPLPHHTLNRLSPPTKVNGVPSSPTHIMSSPPPGLVCTQVSTSPPAQFASPKISVHQSHSHSHKRRGLSSAFTAFFHHQQHHHKERNSLEHKEKHHLPLPVDHVHALEQGETSSTPVSPSSSPNKRIPRTGSLHSLGNFFHVSLSPRFHRGRRRECDSLNGQANPTSQQCQQQCQANDQNGAGVVRRRSSRELEQEAGIMRIVTSCSPSPPPPHDRQKDNGGESFVQTAEVG